MFTRLLKPHHYRLWDTLIPPRWHKVLSDFWQNRSRLGLAVISIGVGVFALGTVMSERHILMTNIFGQFYAARQASASMKLTGFDEGLIEHTRNLPGVAEADGMRTVELRVYLPPSQARGSAKYEWRTLNLIAVEDFEDLRLNLALPVRGEWPPQKNSLVLERSSMKITGVEVGDELLVETLRGLQRSMPVTGVVKDVTVFPGEITGNIAGYITFDTLKWLNEPRLYNRLLIRIAGDDTDKGRVIDEIETLRQRIELDGWSVQSVIVPNESGKPIIVSFFETMVLILHIVGIMLVGISGIMVANTMDALLTHEIKQIGIMRIVGGQIQQIMMIYFAFAVIIGTLALMIAIPLSSVVSRELCRFIASMINYDILVDDVPVWIFLTEACMAYLVAFLASLKPILSSTLFMTVREAISQHGLDSSGKVDWLDRALGKLRGLATPIMLALRNTFRKKWRLGLTLVTLSFGGAIFIAFFCLRSSLLYTAHTLHNEFSRYDLQVTFSRAYHIERLRSEVADFPGVIDVEGWRTLNLPRVRLDGSVSDPINVIVSPSDSQFMEPSVIAGRWMGKDDDLAMVVNKATLDKNPDLSLGGTIRLKYNDREIPWQIVGVTQGAVGVGQIPVLYVNYEAFARATHTSGMVDTLQLAIKDKNAENMLATGEALERYLVSQGFHVKDVQTAGENLYLLEQRVGILTKVLITISALLALVGGICLTSTMGINVIERTAEIGVMRAVGASSGDLLQVTITEACLIGWMSWSIAAVLAIPFGRAFSMRIGQAFMGSPLMFSYSFPGLVIWFGVVTVVAVVASLVPAQNAMNITVREAISYE